ncbi:transposase IS116/IS110/IS902 family protein [Branchiibius hedensis]|uniref:Transposase n=2 Tax=Branchiibius TaxID=908251 RepID=A0A2Y8ZQ13_9MICO|nr:IS110 family transposase [Branchiibius hedensis]PWJ25638.1 transposase IS116/IS110/IS902 family protein [Branchiibius hedensis]SSA34451.1 Transposase [Branchiibius hedensis]
MTSLHTTVADFYRYVVGVDTHAATHSYAIVAANGAAIDHATFPTTRAGLGRARDWIARRSEGDVDGVLISAEGTGSYGAVLAEVLSQAGYRVVEAPTPRRDRGRGKTDALDAMLAARSTLVMPLRRLRDRRAGETYTALRVLTVAREHLNIDRLRCINALTALLRTHDLGIDTRTAMTSAQFTLVAGWRHRDEPLGIATARAEAVRLAKKIMTLNQELANNRAAITSLVTAQAPELLHLHGVGAITAAVVLTVWSHPGRIRTEAAFAQIAGTAPIPASSGNTIRHRLSRGGDRQLNRSLNTIVLTRMRTDPDTRAYIQRRQAEGKTTKEIRRCLKRYVARQIFRTLAAAHPANTTATQAA